MYPLQASDPPFIGPYRLAGRLGQGGMGQVYLGRTAGGRPAAVKVISAQFEDHPEALIRFRREVETLRTVRNAFTAALIDFGVDESPYWLATEYVPGPTLAEAIKQGPLDEEVCRGLFAALAEALTDIHAHGISHRDLKPQNIILSVTGPQLIDFGIARAEEQPGVTQVGMTVGTPGFTAPEALSDGESSGPAADIFGLAATIATAATGRRPYGEGSGFTINQRSMTGDIDLAGVSPDLAELIRDCSNSNPNWRPGAAEIVSQCRPETSLLENPSYRAILARASSTDTNPEPAAPRQRRTEAMAPAPTQVFSSSGPRPGSGPQPGSGSRSGSGRDDSPFFSQATQTSSALASIPRSRVNPLMAAGAVLLLVLAVVLGVKLVGGNDAESASGASTDAAAADQAAKDEKARLAEEAAAEKAEKEAKAEQKAKDEEAAEQKALEKAKKKAEEEERKKAEAEAAAAIDPHMTGPNGMCLAVPATVSNGDLPVMQTCDGSSFQSWEQTPEGALRAENKCLDLGADDMSNGHQVQVWDCNGSEAQVFQWNGDDGYGHSMLQNPLSQRCLTTETNEPGDGAPLMIWDCEGNQNQAWLPS